MPVWTHIKLEGLQGSPVASWDGGVESQHFLDDTVQVLESEDGVEAQRSLAQAAIVQDAVAPQLLTQFLQHRRVFQQLHDERRTGTGCGSEGSEDQLNGGLLTMEGRGRMLAQKSSVWNV